MKSVLIFTSIIALAMAQRPSFAGTSQKVYPELANRFQETDSKSVSTTSTNSTNVVNRIGEPGETSTTAKLPVDARGDADLVHRLNQWPRENRPFWLLNAEAIEKHRNPEGTTTKQKHV